MKTVIYKLSKDFMPAEEAAEAENIFEDTSNILNMSQSRMKQQLSLYFAQLIFKLKSTH